MRRHAAICKIYRRHSKRADNPDLYELRVSHEKSTSACSFRGHLIDQNVGIGIQVGSYCSVCLRAISHRTALGPRASRAPIREFSNALYFTVIAAGETPNAA